MIHVIEMEDGTLERTSNVSHATHTLFERLQFTPDFGAKDAVHLGVYTDVETTGLNSSSDEIIQCTTCKFWFNDSGEIGRVEQPKTWFNEPKRCQLTADISNLTGITTQMLVGQTLPPEELAAELNAARVVFAHNAFFDRKFIDAHCRNLLKERMTWLCSQRDVPWGRYDFKTAKLEYIAFKLGFVYDAHMSEPDVVAGIRVLSSRLGDRTVLRHTFGGLVPKRAILATGSPFSKKDVLKRYGYNWNQIERVWEKEVDEEDAESELTWLNEEIYRGTHSAPSSHRIPIWDRYK